MRRFGPEVVLHGDAYDEAYQHACRLAEEQGLTFIHPYDDPEVIAGQGTVGMEILRQSRGAPYAIFVPVGGGGLIAGVAAYVKYLYPEVKIIGVEPLDAPSLCRALEAGERVVLDQVGHLRRRRRGTPGRRGAVPHRQPVRGRGDPRQRPTRSARPSRTSSTTRAPLRSRRARSRWPV